MLILTLLSSIALAQAFVDTQGHPHEQFVEVLRQRGVVEGYGYGIYGPDRLVNRAEFLKVLMIATNRYDENSIAIPCFTDFTGSPEWYWAHACRAKLDDIVDGYPDGSFGGARFINLVEAYKMTIDAGQIPLLTYDYAVSPWYKPYVDTAAIRGAGGLFPDNPAYLITRSDMAAMIVRLLNLDQDEVDQKLDYSTGVCGNGVIERGEECDDGNTEVGDGCSDLCIVVPEPIRHGALRIDQKPVLSTQTYAAGTDDVTLFAFEAVAGRQDVQLSSLSFTASTGDLSDMQNYRVLWDRNRDGIPESIQALAVPQGNVLTFTTDIDLTEGSLELFSIVADIPVSSTSGDIGLTFQTSSPSYIEAIGLVDGFTLQGITTNASECTDFSVCWIDVTVLATQGTVELSDKGNLFVTVDATPVPSRQILAGETSDTLLRLNFAARDEEIEVTKVRLGGGGGSSIDRLKLTHEGASQPFADATVSACGSSANGDFCADTDFTISKDDDRTVFISAVVKSDAEGAISGDTVAITVSAAVTGTVAIEARGTQSTADLSQNDGDASDEGEIFVGTSTVSGNVGFSGNTSDTVFAKLTSISNVNVDANDTTVPTGEHQIGVFRFQAADHSNNQSGINAVVMDQIKFSVVANNVSIDSSSYVLINPLDPTVITTCSGGSTGSFTVTCSGLAASAVSTAVPEGEAITLALRADILDARVDDAENSLLQVSLNNLSNRNNTGTITWNDEDGMFGWVDIGSTTVSSTSYRLR